MTPFQHTGSLGFGERFRGQLFQLTLKYNPAKKSCHRYLSCFMGKQNWRTNLQAKKKNENQCDINLI